MSPTKNTQLKTVRIPDDIADWIKQRAKRRGWSVNKWLNWAVRQALRSHSKKSKGVSNGRVYEHKR